MEIVAFESQLNIAEKMCRDGLVIQACSFVSCALSEEKSEIDKLTAELNAISNSESGILLGNQGVFDFGSNPESEQLYKKALALAAANDYWKSLKYCDDCIEAAVLEGNPHLFKSIQRIAECARWNIIISRLNRLS